MFAGLWGDVEGWTPNRTLYKGSGVVAATARRFCGREWGGRYVSAPAEQVRSSHEVVGQGGRPSRLHV